MGQARVKATFMRGGTSKGLMFNPNDLPRDPIERDRIILAAMGSPDPYGRQLDGMGGGVSSLSKICIVGPSSRPDADVDYTFGQVSIDQPLVDYAGNCGNMSSAVGPYAVDEGLVTVPDDGDVCVRIHNTNTGKIIASRFRMSGGEAQTTGDFAFDGVAGTASPIKLEFLHPGGSKTGKTLPTGNPVDLIDVPGLGLVEASLVDAGNPFVFVNAQAVGLTGGELPRDIQQDVALMNRLEFIRCAASVMMGLAPDANAAAGIVSIPKVAMLAPPATTRLLSGNELEGDSCDILARAISVGQAHNAIPLTGALCLATACRMTETLANRIVGQTKDSIRIGHPSGMIVVDAKMDDAEVASATVYRTARRLFKGDVFIPGAVKD